uniref:Uncharacterized protein n=1 Tax=Cannabis sativa TaxID=3483 RepID=A0A803QDQ8_CANSA
MEEIEEVSNNEEDPTKTIRVGKNLPPAVREDVINTVRDNQDALGWSHSDMTRINQNTIFHALNIQKDVTPVRQKRRPLDPVRVDVVKAEVDKLPTNDFLQESLYPFGLQTQCWSQTRNMEDMHRLYRP